MDVPSNDSPIRFELLQRTNQSHVLFAQARVNAGAAMKTYPRIATPAIMRPIAIVTVSWAIIVSADAFVASSADQKPEGVARPNLSKATLQAGTRILKPLHIRECWPRESVFGDALIRMNEDTIESLDIGSGKTRWTSKSQDGAKLSLLGEHQGDLLLKVHICTMGKDEKTVYPPCMVRRLRLKDGNWLEPLAIPLADSERKTANEATAILSDRNALIVLSKSRTPRDKPISYRLTRFKGNARNVAWSKSYPSAGTMREPDAFLLGSWGPTWDNGAIQHLSGLGSRVLVCAGPLEDLMAIQPSDGKSIWTMRRLWEIRRYFIGPSVWQYFLGRYGFQDHEVELANLTLEQLKAKNKRGEGFSSEDWFQRIKKAVDEARTRIEKQPGSIVAGPIVVATGDKRHHFRIFVATARCDGPQWPNYLSDCVVYELDGDGKPIGTVVLPKFVRGVDHSIIDRSVFWSCEDDGLARLTPSPERGNGDLVVDLEWHVDRLKKEADFWMRDGDLPNSMPIADGWMIRMQQGAYVETPKSRIIRVPISLVNLKTNRDASVVLSIPFEGKIPIPTENYSMRSSATGTQWTMSGSFPISVSKIEVRGSLISIVIESTTNVAIDNKKPIATDDDKPVYSIEFDWRQVIAAAEQLAQFHDEQR
jgi:hypothetical protein